MRALCKESQTVPHGRKTLCISAKARGMFMYGRATRENATVKRAALKWQVFTATHCKKNVPPIESYLGNVHCLLINIYASIPATRRQHRKRLTNSAADIEYGRCALNIRYKVARITGIEGNPAFSLMIIQTCVVVHFYSRVRIQAVLGGE
jgi:hypothetical protein